MKTVTTNLKQVLTVNHEQEMLHALKVHGTCFKKWMPEGKDLVLYSN